jgi:hypothetical protein
VLIVDLQDTAVGGDELGREEVVDGEAMLADQEADPAAEGQPADADRPGVAEPGGQPVGTHRLGVGAGGQPGLGPGGTASAVDVQVGHGRQVEDDAAVAGAVAGQAVPAAAHGQLKAAVAGQADDLGDLGRGGGPDHRRGPAVPLAVEDLAGLVVAGVGGGGDAAVEAVAELGDRDGRGGCRGQEGSLQCESRQRPPYRPPPTARPSSTRLPRSRPPTPGRASPEPAGIGAPSGRVARAGEQWIGLSPGPTRPWAW